MFTKTTLRVVLVAVLVLGVCVTESISGKKGGKPGGGGGGDARFSIVELDFLYPEAISEAPLGEVWVVGDNPDPVYTSAYAWRQDANGQVTSGFLPEPELIRPDGSVYTRDSNANDVNEFGDAVGGALAEVGWWTEEGEPRDTKSHALLWTLDNQDQFVLQDLDLLGLFGNSSARAINNGRTVVGTFNIGTGTTAFVWTEATGMSDLNNLLSDNDAAAWFLSQPKGINDNGVVAGHGRLNGSVRGFVMDLTSGVVLAVPLINGAVDNACVGINENGHVSGTARMADGLSRAFVWKGPGNDPVDLGNMGHDGAVGRDLNHQPQIVGDSVILAESEFDVRWVATLWEENGQSWTGVALETQIPPPRKKKPTWELKQARGVNGDGWIVGQGSKVGRRQITSAGFLLIPNGP